MTFAPDLCAGASTDSVRVTVTHGKQTGCHYDDSRSRTKDSGGLGQGRMRPGKARTGRQTDQPARSDDRAVVAKRSAGRVGAVDSGWHYVLVSFSARLDHVVFELGSLDTC